MQAPDCDVTFYWGKIRFAIALICLPLQRQTHGMLLQDRAEVWNAKGEFCAVGDYGQTVRDINKGNKTDPLCWGCSMPWAHFQPSVGGATCQKSVFRVFPIKKSQKQTPASWDRSIRWAYFQLPVGGTTYRKSVFHVFLQNGKSYEKLIKQTSP